MKELSIADCRLLIEVSPGSDSDRVNLKSRIDM